MDRIKRMGVVMAEPTSSSAAGAAFGWKMIGGMAGVAGIGGGLATLIVMLMTKPRDQREWVASLICTLLGSVFGGALVIKHFGLIEWATDMVGLVGLIGIVFACGLPGWTIVRSAFTWMERRKEKDLGEIVDEVRKQIAGNANETH